MREQLLNITENKLIDIAVKRNYQGYVKIILKEEI